MLLMRLLVALVASFCVSIAAHAAVAVPIGGGFDTPLFIALDSAGNVVVTELMRPGAKRILVAGGYTTVETLGSGLGPSAGLTVVTVDDNDNIFVADLDAMAVTRIRRLLAADGYTTIQTLWTAPPPGQQDLPFVARDLAVDSAGNIVISVNNNSIARLLAAGGYTNLQTLATGFGRGTIAVDASDNIYVTEVQENAVRRLLAADGYATVETLGSGFTAPFGVAVDGNGDVYVTEEGGSVKKIEAAGGYTNVTTIITLTGPFDLSVDGVGDLYVAEPGVRRVVKILMSVDPTTTSLTSDFNPSVFRQTVTFTATVSGNNPTGTVNFFAGPGLLCGAPIPVGSNQVSCSFTGLLAMSHSITAVYSGDAVNFTSTSAPITQVVNQAATTTSVSAPGPVILGQPVVVTATVAVAAPGGGTPTGVISIGDGSVNCSIILPATTCSLTPTGIGPRTVTATYGGDPNYLASSNTTPLSVVGPPTSTTLASSINPSVYGQGVTFTATVTGNAPGGSVDFLDGATPLCSAVVLAGAQATCTTDALTAGTHSITATYSGDAGNAASESAPLAQVVDPATTLTSVGAPGPITLGQSVVVTATLAVAAPGSGTPAGTIVISDGPVTCSIVLPVNACSLTPTMAGERTIIASYSGDANFAASGGSASLTVDPSVTGTALASDINPSVRGQSVTFTATVTGNAPTGTVDFLDGATPLCTAVALAGVQATCASSTLGVGTHSITAAYSGDAGNASSTSAPLVQVVDQAGTVTSVSAPGSITLGKPVMVTATVAVSAPGAGTPTGVIAVGDGKDICSITLPATTCSLTPTSTGLRTLTANYGGDADHLPSSATTPLDVVAPATSTTLASTINPSVYGQSLSFTATVTGNAPVGSVDFLDGAAPLCSGVVLAAAQATCTTNSLAAGPHAITAVYGGDADNMASTSAPLTQSVNPAATSISVSAPGPIALGEAVLVTATVAVSAPGVGTPTGAIAISDGAVSCSIELPATSCSLTPTVAGARTITANYAGDTNFTASTGTVSLGVDTAAQTIIVDAPGTVSLNDGTVIVTASASSGLPITLASNTPGVCSVSGTGPFTVTLLAPGLCTLVASQAGDAENTPASLVIDLQVQGQPVPQAIVVPALDLRSLLGLALLLGMIGVLHARRA